MPPTRTPGAARTGSAPVAPPVAGACPSVGNVVARVDGGLARIRVPGGRIAAPALLAVAEAAERWGNGTVEITSRANLQLRGVRAGAAAALADALVRSGLSAGTLGDRRRNILLDPMGDLDPEAEDLAPLLSALLAAFDAEPRLDGLDDKFGVALDGGGTWGIGGRRAALVASAAGAPGVLHLHWGWAPEGAEGSPGRPRIVARGALVDALVELAVASVARPRTSVPVPATVAGAPRVAGPLGAGPGWVGAMPLLGRVSAPTVAAVAAASARWSGGRVRLTPWRGIVLPGVAGADAEAVVGTLGQAGLVVDPSDPASTVVACAGSQGCTSGLTDALGDARRVIAARRQAASAPLALHVSGCAKCCAHHGALPLTLIGSGPGRYDVLAWAERRASGVPADKALTEAARAHQDRS